MAEGGIIVAEDSPRKKGKAYLLLIGRFNGNGNGSGTADRQAHAACDTTNAGEWRYRPNLMRPQNHHPKER